MKPLLMLSLPNSGSTWFAATLAKHIPGCVYYDKEFFNPVCNMKHERILRKQFGSELVSCYKNIALPGCTGIDDDIRATWGTEQYTFTKECQSAFKLDTFMEHFTCFVFLRSPQHTFPPGRARVWSFYEHAWWSLREAGYEVKEEGTAERAMEAHAVLSHAVLRSAGRLNVPTIWWEDVFKNPRAVTGRLQQVFTVQDSLADDIIMTARAREAAIA